MAFGNPFGFRTDGSGPNVRYEFRTSGGGGAGSAGEFSDFFRVFFGGEEAATGVPGGAGRRRAGGGASFEDILAEMGLNQPGATGPGGPRMAPGGRSAGRQTAEAVAEIGLEEAYHGTVRRVEIDGRRLDVTIPRGAENGTKIKLSGQGPGGGDLVVTTRVRPHPVFTRHGADLERELPITLEEALLGGEVPVTTLKGKVLLKIPAGTQNGHRFRLKGQGMPKLRERGNGDLYARARVVLPSKLEGAAAEAARAFFDTLDQPDPRAG